jgi:hypothetical protein
MKKNCLKEFLKSKIWHPAENMTEGGLEKGYWTKYYLHNLFISHKKSTFMVLLWHFRSYLGGTRYARKKGGMWFVFRAKPKKRTTSPFFASVVSKKHLNLL